MESSLCDVTHFMARASVLAGAELTALVMTAVIRAGWTRKSLEEIIWDYFFFIFSTALLGTASCIIQYKFIIQHKKKKKEKEKLRKEAKTQKGYVQRD